MARAFLIARLQCKRMGNNIQHQSKEPPESMLLHFVAFTPEIHIIKNEFRHKGGITWDFLPSIVAVAACMICCYWRRNRQSFIQLIEKGNKIIQIIQRTLAIPYRDVNAFILCDTGAPESVLGDSL